MTTTASVLAVVLATCVGVVSSPGTAMSGETSGPIVLTVGNYSASRIHSVNADGTGLRALTHGPHADDSPEWSQDKARIVFVRRVQVGEDFRGDPIYRQDVWVMDADGRQARLVVPNASDPSWSPDGSRIAFVRRSHIWTVDVVSRRQRQLTNGKQEAHPAWSPDGTQIAYERWLDPKSSIFVMKADGSRKRRLTLASVDAARPAWSPNGRWIVFQSEFNGDGLFVVGADGRRLERLAGRVASKDDIAPDWSPNGRLILFERDAGNGVVDDLYVIGSGGSDLRKLARHTNEPAWSPDGRHIAFVKSDRLLDVVDVQQGETRRIARLPFISDLDW